MVGWPSNLPQFVLEQGFSETLGDAKIESRMEAGASKARRRYTNAPRIFTASIACTADQKEVFDAFYESNCEYGTLDFDWVEPASRSLATFRFVNPPPKWSVRNGVFIASFAMMRKRRNTVATGTVSAFGAANGFGSALGSGFRIAAASGVATGAGSAAAATATQAARAGAATGAGSAAATGRAIAAASGTATGTGGASGVTTGGLTAPVLTRTTSAGTNPMEWDSNFTSYIVWDPATSTGDKHQMQFRLNSGSWTTETYQNLDDELLLGGFTWPLWEAAKPIAGGTLVEVQERRARYVSGVQTAESAWSNTVSDTLSGTPFAPSQLFGVGDVGYAWDPTDGTKVWQSNAGTTAGSFTNPVGRLSDISGLNNHLNSTADNTTRPTYVNVSNGMVQFDGSNDILKSVGGFWSAGTFTAVFAIKAASQAAPIFWAETASGSSGPVYAPGMRMDNADNYVYIRTDGFGTTISTRDTNLHDNTAHVYAVTDSGTEIKLYVDGVLKSTYSYSRAGMTLTPNQSTFGDATPANGSFEPAAFHLGAGVIIDRVLNSTELGDMTQWVADQHGITLP